MITDPVLEDGTDDPSPARLVEVAIDAAGGAGGRTYTYRAVDDLADVVAGDAVIVEFGRRQALGVVVGDAPPDADPSLARPTKPLLARVRSDGPLLPALSVALARWIAGHYLAPLSSVIRAMLPPGMLERLELVADAVAADAVEDDLPADDRTLVDQLTGGARRVSDLDSTEGRAGLLRRLHRLAGAGRLTLDWTLTTAGAGPRTDRLATATEAGRAAAATLAAGGRPDGPRLGPRQIALLSELVAQGGAVRTPELADRHGDGTLRGLVRRGLVEVATTVAERRPLEGRAVGRRGARPLDAAFTPPQAEAIDQARRAVEARDPTPLLLDGVTGGGKTAIYVEAIVAALEAGRPALVLVPEIALALPLVDRLRAELDAEIALVHSGLGDGERADEWRRIRSGRTPIVVGTRLAVLAPLADLGLVIVDEEHDGAYKSERTPRLNARAAAIELGRLAGAAVVLGSATPSVESVGRARAGTYRRVALPTRPTGAPPIVEVVDLRAELASGNRGLISARLAAALVALDPSTGERAILVMNRRGAASAVLCRDCGAVQSCPECTLPLVFHQAGMTLRCHHCGTATPLATRCPACGSPRIRYLGGGTQRVEAEVRARFPKLRIGRLDRDIVERRHAAERVVDAFTNGGLDLLVGTSLVTKGLDIPEVTLVGVVSADIALNLPDERAAERTYQLLAQAVGRAGRGDRPGLAIIQSYQPDHPAIRAVATADAAAFYDAELATRERWGAPPFGRYVKCTVALADPVAAEREASAMAERLRARAAERGLRVEVIGPAPAYIAKRADRWRWNVVLRGPAPADLLDGGLEAPWSVDVDPESLL
ncbi:MAG TPA: primosomal protein N' [Candidatus Limnocylindrales bacterium]